MPGYSKSYSERYTLKWRPVQTTAPTEKPAQKRFAENQNVPFCQPKSKAKRI